MKETGRASSIPQRFIAYVEGWVLRHADHVVVIHDRFAERVHADFGVGRERISVIRNWNHLQAPRLVERQQARAALGWSDHEVVVLHAGNMGVKQGLENIIDGAKLASHEGRLLRFVLLGDGSRRDALLAYASGLPTVQFIDPLEDDEFTAALQAADLLIVNELPGVSEMAVPSKLTSYFASGRPVIAATDPSGITASEIRAAGAGVVVPAANPRALVDAIVKVASDVSEADQMGLNGRAYRERLLSAEHAMELFDNLLSKMLMTDAKTDGVAGKSGV